MRSMSPASGTAGQTVTLTGSNLFSASGLIMAHFGAATAPVSCPTQSRCTATVPSGSGSVLVTITTDRGTSRPVRFTYAKH